MKLKEAVEIIEEIAPISLGESWDNNGIQIDVGNDSIDSILFALEINDDVIDEAIKMESDLIVTHHPLLFRPLSRISLDDISGRYAIKLIKSGISLYSSHTCFDKAALGNNFYMASLLDMRNVEEIEGDIGIIGEFNVSMTLADAISHVEKSLDLPQDYIRSVGDLDDYVKTVALCTGAGGDIIYSAKKLGADLVITGDVKFNIAQDAKAMGLALLDAGHYGTEKIFSENMMEQFKLIAQEKGFTIDTKVAQANTNPFNL